MAKKSSRIADFLIQTKIISRLTASSVILYGLYLVNNYLTADQILPEMLAIAAAIISGAATFLFMSEK